MVAAEGVVVRKLCSRGDVALVAVECTCRLVARTAAAQSAGAQEVTVQRRRQAAAWFGCKHVSLSIFNMDDGLGVVHA
jgi:hypothetical protein